MHIRNRRFGASWPIVVVVAVTLLAACTGESSSPGSSANTNVTQPAAEAPPEVGQYATDWPLPGRDYANSRAVADSPITAANVDQLQELWRAPIEGFGAIGNASTTPLIMGDRVIVQTLDSTVHVFDRATGELRWETKVDNGINIGPNGVAVGWDRVFASKGNRSVFALDLASGRELWSTEVATTATEGIDIQPQVADGLVLVSTVPVSIQGQFKGGDRGTLYALDEKTGDVVWTFDTVKGDDLWGDPSVNSGGGAWFTPAVDLQAGVVYWGIGNPAPFPGTADQPNGSSRPGPNLYTESVVALDLRTGELLWYDQVFDHDLFDRDHTHTMIVDTGSDLGRIVVSTGKGGVVVGHDPATGAELWRTQVGRHQNDGLTSLDGPTEVWPGTFGGVITPPAHADGVVYVATLNAPTNLSPDVEEYIGSELGTAPGEIAAVKASDGTLLWSTEVPGDPLGGATVVGDLVFTGTYQGHLYALDRTTGEIVWDHEAPGQLNGWPAVSGNMIVWPIGLSDPPMLLALGLPG